MVYISYIARHSLSSIHQFLFFILHDLSIPFALFIPLCQLCLPRSLHCRLGTFFFRSIFPIVLFTGFCLTYHSHSTLIPTSSVFTSYGLSYLFFGLELVTPQYIHYTQHLVSFFSYMYTFYRLSFFPKTIELFMLLLPCPFMHLLFLFRRHHALAGFFFIHLGLLGTFFTISHDQYWLFSQPLSCIQRMCLQQIPCLFLCSLLYSKKSLLLQYPFMQIS